MGTGWVFGGSRSAGVLGKNYISTARQKAVSQRTVFLVRTSKPQTSSYKGKTAQQDPQVDKSTSEARLHLPLP